MTRKMLLPLLLVLTSCSSVQKAKSIDQPLNTIYAAVEKAMTMGIQKYSENRRQIFSRPFVVTQSEEFKNTGERERGVAQVWILGDMRPYDVEVEVTIERARVTAENVGREQYSEVRKDKALARKLLDNILHQLSRRETRRNKIDDFQAF